MAFGGCFTAKLQIKHATDVGSQRACFGRVALGHF